MVMLFVHLAFLVPISLVDMAKNYAPFWPHRVIVLYLTFVVVLFVHLAFLEPLYYFCLRTCRRHFPMV